jgi:hypothetical protein
MNIEKKNLLKIFFEIILIILVIITINILPENNKNSVFSVPESNVVLGVIGCSDGPTTIFLGREFNFINTYKNLIFVIIIVSLLILIIIDIISLIKSRKYNKKFKIKIILTIDIFLVIMFLIYYFIEIFGFKFIGISILLNIFLLTIIFIKEILLKIINYENKYEE